MKQYLWAFNLLFFSGYSYLVAQAFNHVVEERFFPMLYKQPQTASEVRKWRRDKNRDPKDYQVISYRSVFDSKNALKPIEPPIDTDVSEDHQDDPTDLPKAKLNAILLGVIIFHHEDKSRAIIELNKERRFLGLGEKIEDAVIEKIEEDRVTVKRENGRLEVMSLNDEEVDSPPPEQNASNLDSEGDSEPPEAGIKQIDPNHFVVSRERVDAAMSDMNAILRQARAIPYSDPVTKKAAGFKIVAIRPGSIYRQLGIRNGDIIKRVNGSELNTIESAMTLFSTMKSEANFAIDLVRRGEKKSFTYEIQ